MPRKKITEVIDWDSAKADPVEFTRTFLRQPDGSKWEPFEAQQTILRGIKRNTSIITGRQFSKTTILGWYVSWFGVTKANSLIWILAPTVDQTRIVFNEIANYFRTTLKGMVDGKIKSSPFPEIQLKNGTKICCRGLNRPEYVRGNRAHLIVCDEAAFIKEGSIREVVEQMLLVTGQREASALVLTSTPFGNGEYYEWTEVAKKQAELDDPRFAYFHYTSLENPYADKRQLEEVKQRYGEDSAIWRAEYLGEFQDDELAVFSSLDIQAAYDAWPTDKYGRVEKFPVGFLEGHKYVQGVDLANRSDYFVSTVLDRTDSQAVRLVHMDRYRRKGYTFYKNRVRANYRAYGKAQTIGDATSLGESVIEDLRDISIVGYTFGGNAAKWEVVQELSRMFQERRIIIPNQRDIISELSYFRYFVTPSKVLRMEAPRGKHDDIVMSLALAAHLTVVPSTLGLFRSTSLAQGTGPKWTREQYEAYNPFADDDDAA